MMLKSSVLCISVLLIESISCQCFGGLDAFGMGYGPLGGPFSPSLGPSIGPVIAPAAAPILASSGGGFSVTSASPIAPTGLSILSENLAIDGGLAVGGQLPFLGTVALAGDFPTVGAGAVSYGCGDGAIGIIAESPIGPLGPVGAPGLGYRSGCGNGVWY
ncbi:chorion class CB protein PC404 [Manduca sexta]|uniref:Uncharacterized protein n=1 Tax=Manduca sexta TaxID=7130 RepID=A0A922CIC0_MANSE|nr:chorion class CB protein PC404 [Manduca sexta]KAG6447202.1 hypothetical protein O3G_MSEX004886 [Manduca sexta]KAG6447203.1 hypothetical protein O3G_MSEX004886 [Manduca sexta]